MTQPKVACNGQGNEGQRNSRFRNSSAHHSFAPRLTVLSRSERRHSSWTSSWCLSLLLALAGCAKLELGENLALWKSDPKPQTPETLSAVWTETTLHQPGKPVVRGFGGRILFHGTDQQQAVPVEGAVIVYAYDNDRPHKEDPAPDKKFVFPAENLAKHQSESSLGPSYSFWLPWDNAGGPQRRISLLTRFEDKSGKIVMSQMAHVTLPGPVALPVPDHAPAVLHGIQPASYEAPATAPTQPAAQPTSAMEVGECAMGKLNSIPPT
mgnify:CR=1 FL=1